METSLQLHQWHLSHGARFVEINAATAPGDYGDSAAEYRALSETCGVLDLSFRGRLCLIGADRQRFLHGQVTNDINALKPGQGCYAALVTAKGKMVSDIYAYVLEDELLLDFESGLKQAVTERLEKYIIADDVQVVDAQSLYGLLSVQGPEAARVAQVLTGTAELPREQLSFVTVPGNDAGAIYVMNQPRLGTSGYDCFAPAAALRQLAEDLCKAAEAAGGRLCGGEAFETRRIVQGIPRFKADMDESNLPQEAGLEARAISYRKGCYIGQEIIARVRTYGQVAKALRQVCFANDQPLPKPGDKLLHDGKEVGWVTSAARSLLDGEQVGLAYVRREVNAPGTELELQSTASAAKVVVVGEVNA